MLTGWDDVMKFVRGSTLADIVPLIGPIDSKMHLISVISDTHKGARHLAPDINAFFLCTSMETSKY